VKPRHIRSFCLACLIACGLAGGAPPALGAATYAESDAQLAEKLQTALQSDPYINDTHIEVSVERGTVYLRGFVMGAWDLQDAIRIAHRVAVGRRVIDELSIELGGRK
jgi:osmotically-inducible protein OsmY